MARDFPIGRLNVRKAGTIGSSDLWGPHLWNFSACTTATANDGVIPYGVTIGSVSVKSYQGNVKPKSTLASFTEITTLIDSGYVPQVESDVNVSVKFQWPGDTFKGKKATLIFFLTLSNAGTHPFYWQYVHVE